MAGTVGEPGTPGDLALVAGAYDALNRRDIDGALEMHHPDAQYDWSRSIGPYAGVYRGHDAIRDFVQTFLDAVEQLRFDIEEIETVNGEVLAMVRATIRGRGSGAVAVATGPHVWLVEAGRLRRMALFQSREEALGSLRGET